MYFFFSDDSTHKSSRNGLGKLVAFGGILLEDTQLRRVTHEVDEILNKYSVPLNEEIKWSPRKGTWIYNNLHDSNRLDCYREILLSAKNAGAKAVVTVCDPAMRNLKPEWGFERCVTYSLERVSTFLVNNKAEAVIISDRPSGGHKQADEFLASYIEHLQSNYNHMVEGAFSLNMLTAPSHMLRQLQVSDLVVSITTAMVSGNTEYASSYFDIVKEMMLTNSFGYIGGTGLKVYPDQLTNLYHWVLGKNTFSKVSRMSGVSLPYEGYLYFENSGT